MRVREHGFKKRLEDPPIILEEDKGDINLGFLAIFFVITFFGFGISTALAVSSNLRESAPVEITEEELAAYRKSQEIVVSANVLLFLGIKKIDETPQEKVYTVSGNRGVSIPEGFSIRDYETNKGIYSQDTSPGDGVVVKIPVEYKKIILSNNN